MSDYLAIISLNVGGGSYARGKDKADTIKRAASIFRSDWKSLFKIKKGQTVSINVYDVEGHDKVYWDDFGVHGDNSKEPIPRLELVKHTY